MECPSGASCHWGAFLWQIEKSDLYPRGWGKLAYYRLPFMVNTLPNSQWAALVCPMWTRTERVDAGRRQHGSKSRVENGGIFDPTLSIIFSVRLYLRISLQEAHGVPYLSQKLYSHNPSVLAFDAGNDRHQTAPHKLHSVSFLSLSLCLTQSLKWGDTPPLEVLAENSRVA